MRSIPDELRHRAFTVEQATAVGVTLRQLQGQRFVRIHRGVYRFCDAEPTVQLMSDAALLALGPGHAISHLTNLRLRGIVGS